MSQSFRILSDASLPMGQICSVLSPMMVGLGSRAAHISMQDMPFIVQSKIVLALLDVPIPGFPALLIRPAGFGNRLD
jgi:hypothetical protein